MKILVTGHKGFIGSHVYEHLTDIGFDVDGYDSPYDIGDFRTNKSLGADYEPYDLSEEEKKIVLRAAETSGCYFCGVDTIVNDGKIYVLEVNGSPGTGDSNEISYMNYYGDKKSRINGSKMVDNLLDYISDKDNWAFPKTSVGRIEWVKI